MSEILPDLALTTLLSAGREVEPQLPQDLLRKAYAIELTHRFDGDRAASFQEIQRLVEEYVNATVSASAVKDSGV